MSKKSVSQNKDYAKILRQVVAEIKQTRVIVANRVNTSIIQMYWNIGKHLSEEGLDKGYGSSVVKRLSVDLKAEFPDAAGFSPRSLWDMKRFYEFYLGKLPQLWQFLGLSWGHHRLILDKMKGENPSIGLILCASKDNVDVEIALRDVNKPIGIAEYKLHLPMKQIKELITVEINRKP